MSGSDGYASLGPVREQALIDLDVAMSGKDTVPLITGATVRLATCFSALLFQPCWEACDDGAVIRQTMGVPHA